jgi:uncharacterized protein with PIN domain
MNRRSAFIAALLALAPWLGKARTRPANNHCPVCNTKAEPHTRPRVLKSIPCDPPNADPSGVVCTEAADPVDTFQVLTRCKFCRVAFFQGGD